MPAPQNVIAIVSDFDDTLTNDSTTQLLAEYSVDAEKFWSAEVAKYVESGYDPSLAFLQGIFDLTGPKGKLRQLSNKRLREFGAKLKLYPGMPGMLDELNAMASQYRRSRPVVELYVISGGFEELIMGSPIGPHLTRCWGCRCAEDPRRKVIARCQNVVDFTSKTRFIFEINKGVDATSRPNPFKVNEYMAENERRIPFTNMIYLGDGLTDVPAFSLVQSRGGIAFAVVRTDNIASRKRAWRQFMRKSRTTGAYTPNYAQEADLGRFIREAVTEICERMEMGVGTTKPLPM